MSSSIELVLGGNTWAKTIGAWGSLKWGHAAQGGSKDASWQMDLPQTFSHPLLRRGTQVEIKVGPANVWSGVLTEIDPSEDWTFQATGTASLAADYLCFDALGNSTTTPDTAIDQAILRGLPWRRLASFSSTPHVTGDETEDLMYLSTLLDARTTSLARRWTVSPDRVVSVVNPNFLVPVWHMAAGSGRFGLADDEYASDIFYRYLASGGSYATATAGDDAARGTFGRREFAVDGTSRGLMTSTAATTAAQNMVTLGKARQGWTNGVTVSRSQLTNRGGVPAYLPLVFAGEMVRMFGVVDEQGVTQPYVDWTIGETQYEAGSDTIELMPLGLASRTLADVLSVDQQ